MFLVFNTSIRNHESFNCASRTHFCKLSSSKLHIEDLQGRLVFNLDLINGTDNNSKIEQILKSIKIDWETENKRSFPIHDVRDVVADQQEHLENAKLKFDSILSKSFRNDKIIELTTVEPFNSMFESPEFNSLGYYFVSERFI